MSEPREQHDELTDLDQSIRQHYAGESLDPAMLKRLETMIHAHSAAPSRWRWTRLAAAAVVLIVAGVTWRMLSVRPDPQQVAMSMVQQHLAPFTADIAAEDFASLKTSMASLPFTPIEPERCRQDEYRVVGAKYATLNGQKVAQIRLAYPEGAPLTLYEMRPDQFPGLKAGTMKLNGTPVTIWEEGGLMMALAGTPIVD